MFTRYNLLHLKSLHNRKDRYEAHEYISEGIKSVTEALEQKGDVRCIVVDESRLEEEGIAPAILLAEKRNVPIEYIKKDQYRQVSTTTTPAGILAVLEMPEYSLDSLGDGPMIALSGVADPGNLGTIIRTADWFGFRSIIVSSDTVDPYNDKVVRSTMGSLHRVKIVQAPDLASVLEQLQKNGYSVASCTLTGVPLQSFTPTKKTVLVLGSESHGVEEDVVRLSDQQITIEGDGRTESLNVGIAAGIALHHLYIHL